MESAHQGWGESDSNIQIGSVYERGPKPPQKSMFNSSNACRLAVERWWQKIAVQDTNTKEVFTLIEGYSQYFFLKTIISFVLEKGCLREKIAFKGMLGVTLEFQVRVKTSPVHL